MGVGTGMGQTWNGHEKAPPLTSDGAYSLYAMQNMG